MFESTLIVPDNGGQANNAQPPVAAGTGSNLLTSCCQVDGAVYQYGGISTAGTDDNVFRKYLGISPTWENVTGLTIGSVVRNPKLLRYGSSVAIFGLSVNGFLAVKLVNPVTKTVRDIVTTVASSGLLTTAAIHSNGIAYVKCSGNGAIAQINLNTNAFELFATLPAGGAPCEGVLIDGDSLYFMGGWGGSAHNVNVYRVVIATKAISLWDTLASPDYGTVNQGIVVAGNTFHYVTWVNSDMKYQNYTPRYRVRSKNQFSLGLGYRNASFFGTYDGGLIFGSGTTLPAGTTGWTTGGRLTAVYKIPVPNSGFNLL